ncbi:MAG: aldo/keto reductase [Candidatus Eremiobacteraeota bacterium]|nr:aldo/keto reductase [Candidatus Eremiobacteraeota bacterium]
MHSARTITIGNDFTVNRMGFGAMRLCGKHVWGWPDDRENALRVLRRAVELGVNFIDTADAYGPHVNEEQIAAALFPYPAGVAIATKGGSTRPAPTEWKRDGRPEHLIGACEGSLRRLRLDRIELYQLHAVDPAVPLEEQVGTLRTLRDAGKIRHIGLSNVNLEQLRHAERIAPIASVQNNYNVGNRESEAVLEHCENGGIAFIPYFPLDAGDIVALDALEPIAAAHGATIFAVALAWLLRRSPATLPIPGTSSLEHLAENVAAARLELTDDEYAALEAAAQPSATDRRADS